MTQLNLDGIDKNQEITTSYLKSVIAIPELLRDLVAELQYFNALKEYEIKTNETDNPDTKITPPWENN